MSICKSYKKKKHTTIAGLFMLAMLVFFALTAAALSIAYAENGATYKETAYGERANPCDGTHTGYTAVSTSGGTIFERGNYYLNGDVNGTIYIAANVTLCLNGHDINASNSSDEAALCIESVSLNLHDCGTNVRYYKIDADTKLFTFDGANETDNEGSIKGGAIRGANKGGIEIDRAIIHLLGGNVVGNKNITYDGAGAYISESQAVIKNMNFIGNFSGGGGGGLHVEGERSNVNIENSVIKQNFASIGGGVNIIKANVNIVNTVISNNIAGSAVGGGGIFSSEAALTINNSTITDSLSGGFGGGMYLNKGITTLKDTSIIENIAADAASNGGGVFAFSAEIKFVGLIKIKNNSVNVTENNLCLIGNAIFNKTDILSEGSQIGISIYSDETAAAIANINIANLAYFVSDEPTKMIVADGSGGLLYKNKPIITFKMDMWDNTGNNIQMFEPNVPFNLNQNPFTKEGCVFLGWSTNSFDNTVDYADKQADVIITKDEDLTLYAVWHENHNGMEFMPVHSLSDISESGGNYVLTDSMDGDITLSGGTTNLCLNDMMVLGNIMVSGSANLNLYTDGTYGFVSSITVNSPQATLTIDSGNIGEITVTQSKDIFINGGKIFKLTAMAGNFSSNNLGKIHISGTPTFESQEITAPSIIIPTAYDGAGTVTRGATIVLSNGKTGNERIPYTGNPIKVALDYKTGNSSPLYGQIVAEDVFETQKDLIEVVGTGSGKLNYKLIFDNGKLIVAHLRDLFDDGVKFYRNNLWDTFRSPAYPNSNRPFYLYDLSAPFDAKMDRIDFSNGKFVKFQRNSAYITVADLPAADKNRIVSSLKYSTYSNEQAILKALIVSEVLYNSDGTVNRVLANVGLIWSLGEQGFLYTSLDRDGAFPYSGGIGTYVTFKAHNDGESIVDNTPKDDPLSKDDFDPDGDGNGIIEIPAQPETLPPANSNIYFYYLGKVIDNNGNPLIGANVAFAYNNMIYNVVTDGSGYFIIPDFLVTAGQETATVYLLYYDGTTEYGIKTYADMPIAIYDAVTYVYPLTASSDDGTVQPPPHTLTAIDCVPPTCSKEGSLAHYICIDTTCGCGKMYGDAQGLNEITAAQTVLPIVEHTFDNGEVTTQPTTDAEGVRTYTCLVCGHLRVESIPKLTGTNVNNTSLLWLIILLAVVNVLELIAILLFLMNKRKRNKTKNNFKLNSNAILPLLLCGGQVITSHLALSVLLGITAILQAVIIIILALKHKSNRDDTDKKQVQ